MSLDRPRRASDHPDPARADEVEQPAGEVSATASDVTETDSSQELRQRVREFAENQWHEPVSVVRLVDVKPQFDVPGRRKDGTIKGKRLIRRFFWNICRGVVAVLVNIVTFFLAGEMGRMGFDESSSKVTGPENARALELADAVKRAKGLWLVHSATHVAMIGSDKATSDPAAGLPPKILWHAAKPNAPRVLLLNQVLTWPDRSRFKYVVSDEEQALIRRELGWR